MKDYYKILELEATATPDQINAQHKFLLQAWHPDKFQNAEQKVKANERAKEINEAYEVLSNPTKRQQYDEVLRYYSSTPAKPLYPQTSPSSAPAELKRYCQSCGLPSETKYVEFYENVGMVFLRRRRSVKGNFCKPCIDFYFWNLTGKTMLVGWWGMISFMVTPFILLNNLFRFIFTFGMKKPTFQRAPNPSPFWVFSTIGGFLLICGFLFALISPASAQPTYAPSPTMVPFPTQIPTRVIVPVVPTSNCARWSNITVAMIGIRTCVYGIVYKTKDVGDSTFQILFSSDPELFFLAAGTYYYAVHPGECVVAQGQVLRSGAGIPYINIDEALYHCESWMK